MIHIQDNYYIGADTSQYTLIKKSIVQEGSNKGKEVQTVIGYYSTIPFAIRSYMDIKARELVSENDYELSEAVGLFEDLNNEMTELLNKLKTGKVK